MDKIDEIRQEADIVECEISKLIADFKDKIPNLSIDLNFKKLAITTPIRNSLDNDIKVKIDITISKNYI